MTLSIPGFETDAYGKPLIPLDAERLFAFGHLLRTSEQTLLSLFGRGLLSGTTHTCVGQEVCQMSVVRALDNPADVVLSNHRNHGHFLTYSGNFPGLLGEVMGRQIGVCAGYGGSQHIAYRNFHSNGIQAGMTGIGVGIGMARRIADSDAIVAIMIGDGTLGEGLLYESMNMASIWGCRVLFVVENNGIAQTTPTAQTLGGSIDARGRAFGLETWRYDDADPEFCAKVESVIQSMRQAPKAGMLVIDTCRLGPHSKGDDLRDAAEIDRIVKRDPLAALGRQLGHETRARIERQNVAFIDSAERLALDSPESVFAERRHSASFRTNTHATATRPAQSANNVRQALNQSLAKLLEEDEQVVLIGEDLHEPYGGAFKVTAGLSSRFPGRVISTPISEAGIVGAAIGMAMSGLRPIVEIMFADFVTLCMDQLYNHAVKFPAMFEDCSVPMVLRTPAGGRRGYGPTHSQNPENLLVSVPGLTVVFPSHRHDSGQLLERAVQDWPNPTVFLEHKLLYGEAQSQGDFECVDAAPSDDAAALFPTLRAGADDPDLTMVTFGGMLAVVERAAKQLADEEELQVEVVVPSLLAPMPRSTLLHALIRRPRILVVEESHHEFGFGAELLALLAEAGYEGTLMRLGMPPVPIAAARSLERDQVPDEYQIVATALDLF